MCCNGEGGEDITLTNPVEGSELVIEIMGNEGEVETGYVLAKEGDNVSVPEGKQMKISTAGAVVEYVCVYPGQLAEEPTPERHEALTDAAGLVEQFEAIGEEFYTDWEAHVPFNQSFLHSGDLKEPFTLDSGASGEFNWLQNPKLYRPGLPELGSKRWLPSGGFNVSETVDGQQILTSYSLGRNLSASTHQPDHAIVIESRYLEDPVEEQKPLGTKLLTTQSGELQKCADLLTEIGSIIKAKDWSSGEKTDEAVADQAEIPSVEVTEASPAPTRAQRLATRILGRNR